MLDHQYLQQLRNSWKQLTYPGLQPFWHCFSACLFLLSMSVVIQHIVTSAADDPPHLGWDECYLQQHISKGPPWSWKLSLPPIMVASFSSGSARAQAIWMKLALELTISQGERLQVLLTLLRSEHQRPL